MTLYYFALLSYERAVKIYGLQITCGTVMSCHHNGSLRWRIYSDNDTPA